MAACTINDLVDGCRWAPSMTALMGPQREGRETKTRAASRMFTFASSAKRRSNFKWVSGPTQIFMPKMQPNAEAKVLYPNHPDLMPNAEAKSAKSANSAKAKGNWKRAARKIASACRNSYRTQSWCTRSRNRQTASQRTGSWKLKTPNCVARTRNLKQGCINLYVVKQNWGSYYLGLVNQMQDIVKHLCVIKRMRYYATTSMRHKENDIFGLCTTLALVRRHCQLFANVGICADSAVGAGNSMRALVRLSLPCATLPPSLSSLCIPPSLPLSSSLPPFSYKYMLLCKFFKYIK